MSERGKMAPAIKKTKILFKPDGSMYMLAGVNEDIAVPLVQDQLLYDMLARGRAIVIIEKPQGGTITADEGSVKDLAAGINDTGAFAPDEDTMGLYSEAGLSRGEAGEAPPSDGEKHERDKRGKNLRNWLIKQSRKNKD